MNVRIPRVKFVLMVPITLLLLTACEKKPSSPIEPCGCAALSAPPAAATAPLYGSEDENPFIMTSEKSSAIYPVDEGFYGEDDPSTASIEHYGNASAPPAETGPAPWNPAHRLMKLSLESDWGDEVEVSFNSREAIAYRLVGTGDRLHSSGSLVTALFEIIEDHPSSDSSPADAQELATVEIHPVDPAKSGDPIHVKSSSTDSGSPDLEFIAAVASVRMIQSSSAYRGNTSYADALAWAVSGRGLDPTGTRQLFIEWLKSLLTPYSAPQYPYTDQVLPAGCCD